LPFKSTPIFAFKAGVKPPMLECGLMKLPYLDEDGEPMMSLGLSSAPYKVRFPEKCMAYLGRGKETCSSWKSSRTLQIVMRGWHIWRKSSQN